MPSVLPASVGGHGDRVADPIKESADVTLVEGALRGIVPARKLSRMLAAAAMSFSSVSVIGNALRLRKARV